MKMSDGKRVLTKLGIFAISIFTLPGIVRASASFVGATDGEATGVALLILVMSVPLGGFILLLSEAT